MIDPSANQLGTAGTAGSRRRASRRSTGFLLTAALVLPWAVAWAETQAPVPPLEATAAAPTLLLNERHALPGTLTGGMPPAVSGEDSAPAFRALASAGVRTFIDLRTAAEAPPETAALAAAAGLDYRQLPVAGEADLDLASARALDRMLDDWTRYPIALACGSGNRVGALLALRAFWLDGVHPDAALELGLRAGLTKLEPAVRLLLGLPPLPVPAPAADPGGEPASNN
ncbi:MAG: hypothetical protein ABI689_10175 [Thermoanaerobaculia bacterium]